MLLYSYKGNDPETLPSRFRTDDGYTKTSLGELSSEELKNLGFIGPIIKPKFDKNTQRIEWNGSIFEVIDLTEDEISQKIAEEKENERRQKLENIDYNNFWRLLTTSVVYKKLLSFATQSLETNIFFTELICLFNDAKIGNPNASDIQKYINILFLRINFTQKEVEELQNFMNQTNLDAQYTLPDEKYLSSHIYDSESNMIVNLPPFNSWILVNGKWQAPSSYPTDGKVYNWNEDLKKWVNI